jgi:acetyltransferase-like isoleucine patch superfamily enzyme
VTARSADIEHDRVSIGDHTFIGANSVVLMGVRIGSHCVIGAGAVVTSDIPDHSWATGVPATVQGRVDPVSGSLVRVRRAEVHPE